MPSRSPLGYIDQFFHWIFGPADRGCDHQDYFVDCQCEQCQSLDDSPHDEEDVISEIEDAIFNLDEMVEFTTDKDVRFILNEAIIKLENLLPDDYFDDDEDDDNPIAGRTY